MSTNVKELTVSAVVIGIVIGVIMTAANVYLGLYAGMTVSASIPAAVLAMGIYKGVLKKSSLLESNIVQTMASAGESLAAGVIFTLPALVLVGAWKNFDFWSTTLIAVAGGLLGVIFMIPLRRALIIEDKSLTYPEGVACAAVLKTGSDSEAKEGFIVILKGLFLGAAFKFVSGGLALLKGSVEIATKFGQSVGFIGLDISPALLSVGYIVKLQVGILVLAGSLIGWTLVIPFLGTPEAYVDLSALDLAWTLWSTKIRYLGVGAMLTGGVWSIISVRRGIVSGMQGLKAAYQNKSNTPSDRMDTDMSLMAIFTIFVLCFAIMLFLYNSLIASFGISLMTTLIMVLAAFIFVAVSSYVCGLVGSSNNPVSGMTISALLVTSVLFLILGFKGDSAILATLGVAAVVCCAACTAGDCSQDLKTGTIVGATPRAQQIAQVIGVCIPAFVIAPVLTLLHSAYGIGVGLKAPQATLFASITKALFGNGDLPMNYVIAGILLGIAVIILDKVFFEKRGGFRLYLMPIAVGIYLPITLNVPIFLGALIRHFVEKSRKTPVDEGNDKGVLVSSGLIAGEAIMGVVIALFLFFNINLKMDVFSHLTGEILSVIALALVGMFLMKTAKKS